MLRFAPSVIVFPFASSTPFVSVRIPPAAKLKFPPRVIVAPPELFTVMLYIV